VPQRIHDSIGMLVFSNHRVTVTQELPRCQARTYKIVCDCNVHLELIKITKLIGSNALKPVRSVARRHGVDGHQRRPPDRFGHIRFIS
jgi:hypothetical protein